MDDLTKQLFDDVRTEQQQRMYEISFALKLLLLSLRFYILLLRLQIAGHRYKKAGGESL